MLSTPIAWRNSHCVGSFGDSSKISISSLSYFGSDSLFKVALYTFLAREEQVRKVFQKKFYFDDVTKKELKTHILRAFQTVNFFDNWHVDRLFLSLTVRKKIIKFYTYNNVLRVKNENCEFLENLCTDFVVGSSVGTAWMFYSVPPRTKKIHRVETQKHRLRVRQIHKTSQSSLSVVPIATTLTF